MKVCSQCNIEKEFTEFSKRRTSRAGYQSYCKKCGKQYRKENKEQIKEGNKQYRIKNKEQIKQYYIKNKEQKKEYHKQYYIKNKEQKKEYRIKNKEQIKEYRIKNKEQIKEYRIKNKEQISKQYKQYYIKNKEQIKEQNKQYYIKNREQLKEQKKQYYIKNREQFKEQKKQYYIKNKGQIKETNKQYANNRMKTDPLFALTCRIRCLIRVSITNKGYTKKSKTHEILGISYVELKEHMERQFTKGMNWENRDQWHIDHIIPLATAQCEDDVIRLNHYTNLQPLWAEDNLSKGSKIIS